MSCTKLHAYAFALALFFFACLPSIAFADCAAPAGIEGETLYNTDFKTIQFCDGTDWISMSGTAATETDPKIGTLTNTKWCATDGSVINCTEDAPGNATPAGTDGQVQFNESSALAADAALHWDNTNKRLGVGAVPSSNGRLHVEASAVNTYTAWFSHTNATNANGINIETATGNAGDIGLRVVSDGGSIVGLVVRNDGDVSIGTASPAATALLDLTSTSKGFLPPRMDTTQRNTIASPAEGLTIYNTTTDSLEFYNGSAWVSAANADVSFAAKGATTSIPNGAWTDAVYPTELRDAGGDNYNPATGKFTAPSDGMYFFAATTQFSGQISAGQWGIIVQTANASTGGTRACYQMNPKASGGANYASVACSGSLYLTAGTQVEATVYQDSGGVQALSTAGSFNGFKVTGGGSGAGGGSASAAGAVAGAVQFNDGASGFAADDVNLVWDDTNDRLGIGTAAPTQKLQIADINPMMSLLTSSAGKQGGMLFYDNTTTDYKWYMGYNYNNAGDGNFFIRRGNDSTGGITLLPDGIGNVGIGTATPAATALLDLTSTSKGFLPPRMDTTQRNTIASPATGLMIYNTTNAGLEVYDGSAWRGVNTSVAFRAHKGGTAQAVAASTATALTFSTETFDTSNNFSTATGRFTPTVAGIYIVTGSVRCDASTTYCQAIIYKNGSGIANHYDYHTAANMAHVTTLVSMNGSTDYLQLYGVSGGAAGNINGGDSNTYFEAALVGGGSGGGGSGTAAGSVAGAVQFNDGASGFAADDVNLVWDDSNDRLGIGTASPTEKLEVTPGNIRIGGNIKLSASNPKIIADNSDTQQGTIELRDLSTGNMILTPSNGGSVQRNLIIPLGKVGIGTTSPDWPLHIRNTAAPVIQLEEVDSSGNAFIGVDGNNLFVRRGTIATADAMTITSTGNVGIGTTSPVYRLHVADTPNSGKIGYLTIGRSGGDYPSVGYNVRYGTTTSTYTYDITDTASMFRFHQGGIQTFTAASGTPGNTISFSTGPYLSQGGTSWTTASDARLKRDVETLSVLDKLDGYRAVRFTWKASGKQDVGVIAQEVYEVFPEVVVTGDEKETVTEGDEAWGVNYEKLGALALEAVKELKAANDNLRSELNAANDNYAADIDALRAIVEEQGRQIERLKAGAP